MKNKSSFFLKCATICLLTGSTLCSKNPGSYKNPPKKSVTTQSSTQSNIQSENTDTQLRVSRNCCPSKSVNILPMLVGWQRFINQADMDESYAALYTAFEYKRSFNNKKNSKSDTFVADLGGYVGLDSVVEGLYLKLRAPIITQRCCNYLQKSSDTFLGGIAAQLGYNFLLDEDYFLGANLLVSAPTNRNSDNYYLNGKNWEIGGGLSGSYKVWEDDEDSYLSVYLDSKFSWLREKTCISSLVTDAADQTDVIDGYCCDTKINHLKADIAVMLEYVYNNWSFDLGYNFLLDSAKCCNKRHNCITNKIFTHVSYAWDDSYEDVVPFVGVGAEIEKQRNCSSYCAGIWLKGGISF